MVPLGLEAASEDHCWMMMLLSTHSLTRSP